MNHFEYNELKALNEEVWLQHELYTKQKPIIVDNNTSAENPAFNRPIVNTSNRVAAIDPKITVSEIQVNSPTEVPNAMKDATGVTASDNTKYSNSPQHSSSHSITDAMSVAAMDDAQYAHHNEVYPSNDISQNLSSHCLFSSPQTEMLPAVSVYLKQNASNNIFVSGRSAQIKSNEFSTRMSPIFKGENSNYETNPCMDMSTHEVTQKIGDDWFHDDDKSDKYFPTHLSPQPVETFEYSQDAILYATPHTSKQIKDLYNKRHSSVSNSSDDSLSEFAKYEDSIAGVELVYSPEGTSLIELPHEVLQ